MLILLLTFINILSNAQVPQGIPYQAVARNGQGQPLASTNVKVRFSVLDSTATGTAVYVESHSTTTSALGLFTANVGMGTATTGTFSSINWGQNFKFLKVELDTTATGNSYIDLGTQQMMSVPYALYAGRAKVADSVFVSTSGDTLFIGKSNYVLIPGVSIYNNSNGAINGSVLLPFNSVCYDQHISVCGCGGQDSLLYNGHVYPLVEINGQCWFKENLQTNKYRNGSPVLNLSPSSWYGTNLPLYTYYNNDSSLANIYGALYNYKVVQDDSVCPIGWHVSTDCDWMYVEKAIGMNSVEQQLTEIRYIDAVKKLVTTNSNLWYDGVILSYGTNELGLSILGSGKLIVYEAPNMNYYYSGKDSDFQVWTKSKYSEKFYRLIFAQQLRIDRYNSDYYKYSGMSIRCVKN